jgi:hypothetical protein
MEHCSSTKLRVLRTMERNLRKEQHKQQQEPMSCQDEDGYEEDDFQLEDYIMSEEEDDDIIQFGIPIRDAGLA